MALDPESRLVVSLVVGKRTAEATHALVRDFRRRTGGPTGARFFGGKVIKELTA